jgi:protein SCO1
MSSTAERGALATVALRSPTRRFAFVGAGLLAATALTGLAVWLRGRSVTPLPVLQAVPDFRFVAQDGAVFSSTQLKGKVWIGNFIFSRCPTICPTFSKHMATIQKSTPQAIEMVSFSVDPLFDTPARLLSYGERFNADFTRWHFLTADSETPVTQLSAALFQPLDKSPVEDLAALVHGSHFILVDQQQNVRGFYKFNDAEALAAVVADAKRLFSERSH